MTQSFNMQRLTPILLIGLIVLVASDRSLLGLDDEPSTVKIEHINPNPAFGLSNAVAAHTPGAKIVYLSGQVGFGPDGIPEDLAEQAEIVFQNVLKQLKDAGAGPDDVVKINAYIKDLDIAKAQVVGEVKGRHFTAENQPASTWVGVTGLVFPNLLVEVEVIAIVGQ